MRIHHAAPLTRRALPHAHPLAPPGVLRPTAITAEARQRRQRLKDQLAVAAVLFLVLATTAFIVSYVIHEAPRWRSGEVGNFEPTPVPVTAQAAPKSVASASDPSATGNALGRVPLILLSTAVEMAIFVALGLYLRHDMNRKP